MASEQGKHKGKSAPAEVPFEDSLRELEALVKQLESAELPLEKALELFERGVELSARCRQQLQEAETRVEILMKKGQSVVAQPFLSGEDAE